MNADRTAELAAALADTPFAKITVFLLGTFIGSFLNVVIARLPEGRSVVRPRSHCPRCGDMIPSWLNVPVLSWLVLRGRCRACKLPISVRYPVVELLTGVLFLACLARFGLGPTTLAAALFAASLVAITFIDIDWWEIPDEITMPWVWLGALLRPLLFGAPWWDGVLGAFGGGAMLGLVALAYYVVRRREGMGLGDLKLLAMIGAFLGWRALLPTVFVAAFTGSVIGGLTLLLRALGARSSTEATEGAQGPEDAGAGASADAAPAGTVDVPVLAIVLGVVEFLLPGWLLRRIFPQSAAAAAASADEEDDWTPPAGALPFGPFLALGALAYLFLGPTISRMLFGGLL